MALSTFFNQIFIKFYPIINRTQVINKYVLGGVDTFLFIWLALSMSGFFFLENALKLFRKKYPREVSNFSGASVQGFRIFLFNFYRDSIVIRNSIDQFIVRINSSFGWFSFHPYSDGALPRFDLMLLNV